MNRHQQHWWRVQISVTLMLMGVALMRLLTRNKTMEETFVVNVSDQHLWNLKQEGCTHSQQIKTHHRCFRLHTHHTHKRKILFSLMHYLTVRAAGTVIRYDCLERHRSTWSQDLSFSSPVNSVKTWWLPKQQSLSGCIELNWFLFWFGYRAQYQLIVRLELLKKRKICFLLATPQLRSSHQPDWPKKLAALCTWHQRWYLGKITAKKLMSSVLELSCMRFLHSQLFSLNMQWWLTMKTWVLTVSASPKATGTGVNFCFSNHRRKTIGHKSFAFKNTVFNHLRCLSGSPFLRLGRNRS